MTHLVTNSIGIARQPLPRPVQPAAPADSRAGSINRRGIAVGRTAPRAEIATNRTPAAEVKAPTVIANDSGPGRNFHAPVSGFHAQAIARETMLFDLRPDPALTRQASDVYRHAAEWGVARASGLDIAV